MINHDHGISIEHTDMDGNLDINPNSLAASYGNSITLTVIDKKYQDRYSLSVEENDQLLNQALARRNFPFLSTSPETEGVFTDEENTFNGQRLATVVVKGRKIPDFMRPEYNQLPIMDGPCAAWVCACNHWMCGGCKPLHNPVKGFSYLDQNTGRFVVYNGCPEDTIVKPFIKKIKGINYARAFQGPDFSQEHADGPFYNTTLYWNYLVLTDDKGEATLEFYTNDLAGRFTCIVEGLSSTGLVSGRKELVVFDQPDLAQTHRQPDQ